MPARLRAEHLQAGKRFVLQVLHISLGVIIALGFDGCVERRRIQKLVDTATAHMRSELEDNREDMKGTLVHIKRNRREIGEARTLIDRWIHAAELRAAGHTSEIPQGGFTFHPFQALLASSSRSTAEATGALGHMLYQKVKRFNEAYVYQQMVQQILDRCAEQSWVVRSTMGPDMSRKSREQMLEFRSALQALDRTLTQLDDQGRKLIEFYDRALAGG